MAIRRRSSEHVVIFHSPSPIKQISIDITLMIQTVICIIYIILLLDISLK